MITTSRWWLAASMLLASCTPQRTQADAAPPAASLAASAAPDLPAQRGQCPLTIVPGRALGPIRIGAPVSALEATGLPIKETSRHGETTFVEAGPFHVETCGGKIVEVWIDDLREAPDCVKVGDKPVDRALKRQALEAMFSGCHDTPGRIGGAFTECENGGLRIGYGMGNFLQVRVARAGSDIDEECADVLDDGGVVTLVPAELTALVQRTLDVDKLAQYWHADKPHRDRLRLLRSPAVASISGADAKPLTMFGSKVVWIDPAAAKDGKPYFELTRIDATRRQVVIHFRYPVEGVIGSATYKKRHDSWDLESASVAER